MPSVREQRHGAEDGPGRDFGDHHGRGERDHQSGAALVARMGRLQKHVVIRGTVALSLLISGPFS
jgi:hypothetical protein